MNVSAEDVDSGEDSVDVDDNVEVDVEVDVDVDVGVGVDVDVDDDDELSVAMVSMSAHTWSESHHSGLFLSSSRLKDLINLDV